MNYSRFTHLLYNSNPEDWIFYDEKGVYLYRHDINIRIVRDELTRDFKESWTKYYANQSASMCNYNLYYGNSFCGAEIIIEVDSNRSLIPLPNKLGSIFSITKEQFNFARIINIGKEEISSYLRIAEISVEPY